MSAGAAMTIALAPAKRVTTAAVRPPCVRDRRLRRRRRRRGRRAGLAAAARSAGAARLRAGRAVAGRCRSWRGVSGVLLRLVGRLADELLEHRQQLLGIGILQEHDPDLGAAAAPSGPARARPAPAARRSPDRRAARSSSSCRPRRPTTPGPARRRPAAACAAAADQRLQRGRDLARAGVLQRDDARRRRCRCRSGAAPRGRGGYCRRNRRRPGCCRRGWR